MRDIDRQVRRAAARLCFHLDRSENVWDVEIDPSASAMLQALLRNAEDETRQAVREKLHQFTEFDIDESDVWEHLDALCNVHDTVASRPMSTTHFAVVAHAVQAAFGTGAECERRVNAIAPNEDHKWSFTEWWTRVCATAAALNQGDVTDGHFDIVRKSAGTYRNFYSKQGRNERCACGSGKKHKRCCGRPK